jgi:hypothetical protein
MPARIYIGGWRVRARRYAVSVGMAEDCRWVHALPPFAEVRADQTAVGESDADRPLGP